MAIDTVIHTNQHSIDRVLNAGLPVVLVFWQGNSGLNEAMDPLLSALATRYAGRALVAKVDAANEAQLVQRYGIQQLPSLVFVKNGAVAATVPGRLGKDDLDAWFAFGVDGHARPSRPKPPSAPSNANGTSMPMVLTDANFQQVIGGGGPVLVDFWAPWCGPCRAVAPAVEALAQEFAGRATVGKLNVDENPRTSQQYGIMSIPALYIFKNGQPVDQIIGAQPAHLLRQRLSAHV